MAGHTIHIRPDSRAGSALLPRLIQARDEIRALKGRLNGQPIEGGVEVLIHGGDWSLDGAFHLTAEDSGTLGSPVVYRTAPGERARILGGRVIRDWRPVSDPTVRERLAPAARGQVLEADLRSMGVGELSAMQSRGFGRSNKGAVPSHIELFSNGLPQTIARWPNPDEGDGWARIAGFPEGSGKNDGHGTILGAIDAGFLYEGDRPQRWAESDDIWVHGYWAYDWANSYERIATLDKSRRFIKTHDPYGLYGIMPGQRFHFLNILEELDQPGEYFVDRARGMIYFWPPAPIDKAEVIVSILDQPMIALDGAEHVTICGPGLTFEACRTHAITVKGGAHVLIAGCTLRNIGNYAVWIDGGSNHGVQSCDISNTGDGGVFLGGGDRATLTPGRHFVDNCHFHHQARWSRCYFPAVYMRGVGARVSHNVIHDHPHCAILFNGNEHLIEFNEIYSTCWETGDVGAIYLGRDYTERGHVIRHNYLHHVGGVGMGSMAVYLDDCASGVSIIGNVFHHNQRAILIGGGRDNVVENNVILDAQIGVHLDGRGVSQVAIWKNMVYDTMKKRLDDMKHSQPPYSTRYPQLKDLDRYYAADQGMPGENNPVRRNIVIGGKWLDICWGARAEWAPLEGNTVEEDSRIARFVDAEHPETAMLQVRGDSPAITRGFKPIPVEKIGHHVDEYRSAWPRVVTLLDFVPTRNTAGSPRGELRVTLINQGTAAWKGSMELTATPRTAARFLDRPVVSAQLAPGGRTTQTIRVESDTGGFEVEAQCGDALTPGARPARIKVKFPVPTPRTSAITGIERVTEALRGVEARPVAGGGTRLGDVRLAVAGSDLAVVAQVMDIAPQRAEKPWEGSCVEVFAAAGGKAKIGQVYLMPSASGLPAAAALEREGQRLATPTVRATSSPSSNGYELAALVPLELLGIDPSVSGFLLEIAFNVPATPGSGPRRATLFGSTHAYNNTAMYGPIELIGP